jgi:hypothetical protein
VLEINGGSLARQKREVLIRLLFFINLSEIWPTGYKPPPKEVKEVKKPVEPPIQLPDLTMKDKVVCITGGSKGLGKSTSQILALSGARVVIISRDKTL